MRYAAPLFALALAACASEPETPMPVPPPPPVVTVQPHPCLKLTPWSDAEQDALALALAPLAPGSIIWKLEKDWQGMRDGTRACLATEPRG